MNTGTPDHTTDGKKKEHASSSSFPRLPHNSTSCLLLQVFNYTYLGHSNFSLLSTGFIGFAHNVFPMLMLSFQSSSRLTLGKLEALFACPTTCDLSSRIRDPTHTLCNESRTTGPQGEVQKSEVYLFLPVVLSPATKMILLNKPEKQNNSP